MPEMVPQLGVEVAEAAHNVGREARPLQNAKNSPPGQRVEALLLVEGHQPERTLLAALQLDDIGDELGEVQRARQRPKAHRRLPKVFTLQHRCPEDNPLCPDPVDDVKHGNGPLVLRPGSPGGLWDHSHIGCQNLLRPQGPPQSPQRGSADPPIEP